jgi:hypothetical protein
MTSDAKQHADKKLNENNDKLISAYTPTVDSMIRPVSAKLDISTTLQPSSSPSMLPDSPVSTNTMCHDSILHDDNDDDIQMLVRFINPLLLKHAWILTLFLALYRPFQFGPTNRRLNQ